MGARLGPARAGMSAGWVIRENPSVSAPWRAHRRPGTAHVGDERARAGVSEGTVPRIEAQAAVAVAALVAGHGRTDARVEDATRRVSDP